ncbi:MAG TPA: DUF1015 domain-containing protein [Acidimicrobiales bacterium]|nr:DUF1015 domain-containing protein [Acidimicrobiales bacterium]
MPRFEPFAGLRYRMSADIDDVVAPPYDVIDEAQREALAARSPFNAVHVEVPVEEEGGGDRYLRAARLLREWRQKGIVAPDDPAALYLYRMGYHDEDGTPRQTTGVIGALELSVPGDGDVLPHEETTPRAKGDRLQLLEATKANLSPIWCLSLGRHLSYLADPLGPPFARCTDEEGVHHRIWRVTSPAVLEGLVEVVESAPVIIADGHHRYETALAYRDRLRADGAGEGPHDFVMALVVELAEDELSVRAIHRVLSGLPPDLDVVEALSPWFSSVPAPGHGISPASMVEAGALGLVLPDGTSCLLVPKADTFPDELPDLDASRLEVARAGLPPHEVAYQAGTEPSVAHVAGRAGSAAVLLRPATVEQIGESARRGVRMPAKTTYFHPKLRTGMVFRSVAG